MWRRFRKWRLTRKLWNGKIDFHEYRDRLGLSPYRDWANHP